MEKSAGQTRFGPALLIATIFKLFAVLSLFGGAFVTMATVIQLDAAGSDDTAGFLGASVAGTILTAAVLAFFGYVLEILVEVYGEVFHVHHELAEAADEG